MHHGDVSFFMAATVVVIMKSISFHADDAASSYATVLRLQLVLCPNLISSP